MILLPFIPAIIELLFPEDKLPLKVNLSYLRNPRYFGLSFRKKLKTALSSYHKVRDGTEIIVKLSKEETVKFLNGNLKSPLNENAIIYFRDGARVPPGSTVTREVFSEGDLEVGRGSTIRAVACDGSCRLEEDVNINRWIDCEGEMDVNSRSRLGVMASTPEGMRLKRGVKFTRLFGNPIETYNVKGDVKPSTSLKGSLKVTGNFHLDRGEYVLIDGSIFSDKDIEINRGIVNGNIFSFGKVKLKNCRVGSERRQISVIGSEVNLGENVKVFGYVQAELSSGEVI